MRYRLYSASLMEFDVHILADWLNYIREEWGIETPLYYHANWDEHYEEEALIVADEELDAEMVCDIHRNELNQRYQEEA